MRGVFKADAWIERVWMKEGWGRRRKVRLQRWHWRQALADSSLALWFGIFGDIST
jgi:hypothetical protein